MKYYSYLRCVIALEEDCNYKVIVHKMREEFNRNSFHTTNIMIEDICDSSQSAYEEYCREKEAARKYRENFKQRVKDFRDNSSQYSNLETNDLPY